MSEASYYSIPEKHRRNYPRLPAKIALQGAFSKPQSAEASTDKLFEVNVPVEVAGQQMSHQFLVSPHLSSPVIMGMDLINKTGVSMDAVANRLVFRGLP